MKPLLLVLWHFLCEILGWIFALFLVFPIGFVVFVFCAIGLMFWRLVCRCTCSDWLREDDDAPFPPLP